MADERNEQENEPKIRIVDRRMLSDDERSGKSAPAEQEADRPRLEIVGGYASGEDDAAQPALAGAGDDIEVDEDGEPLTEEEMDRMRGEVEQEQFAALEQQMGRPLTEQEKDQVRAEMDRQARQMASLEVTPTLQQLLAELSARAAVHMGLMPNPYTRLIARNDTQARLAIDSFQAIYDILKPHLDTNSQREYGRVLNDLTTNFTSITGGSPTGPSRIIH